MSRKIPGAPMKCESRNLNYGQDFTTFILSMFQTSGSKVEMAIPWLSMVICSIFQIFFGGLRTLQSLF